MPLGVGSISVLSELDRLKVQWIAAGGDEVKVRCPAHDDSTPSASMNVREGVWKCYVPSCGASGDLVAFMAYTLQTDRKTVLADLQTRYPTIGHVSVIPSQTVEKFHAALDKAGPLLDALRERGVTEAMMREARLGFFEGRITIPVYDDRGNCINVRRYLPGAPGPQKMRNTTGHGRPALYRVATMVGCERVVVCAGEMKALVVGSMLADKKVAAVCSTGGEGHWDDAWAKLFKGKDVCVMYDVDNAGRAGSKAVAMSLYTTAKSVRVLELPLDREKFPKGDVNDWVGQLGATAADILDLLDRTPDWLPPTKQPKARGEYKRMDLDRAVSNANVGEAVEVDAVIAAADQTPFLVPRCVDVECDRNQPGCPSCAVRAQQVDPDTGWTRMEVEAGGAAVLGMLGCSDKVLRERTCEALGIPTCKAVKFYVRSHHVAHDVRLSPPIDLAGERTGDAWYPAVMVTPKPPDLNVPCRMRGGVYPSPTTQQAVALVSEVEEIDDSLTRFKCTKEELAELEEFKPRGTSTEALVDKVRTIVDDLAANVTWIHQRPDLHVTLAMVWHSVLMFEFEGRLVNGWMNALIAGDSSQGKSECALRLLKHYGVGDRVDCKNATVAGLLGGLEQLGNRWFVKWGSIPRSDRMLVLLEELKGAAVEVLSKLTDMRSSGIAEIPKIERRKAMARTRLAMISNPRSPRQMSSFHFGVEAVGEIMGALEDVRRLDFALAVSNDEVPSEVISRARSSAPKVEHRAVAKLCRRLVLWAWTRKPEQVRFREDTVDAVIEQSRKLTAKYSEAMPLIDRGTTRHKLARMSAAIAAMTYSSPDGHYLEVQRRHVEFVSDFVDRAYSSKAMGYADYSAAQDLMQHVQDPQSVERALRGTKHPGDLASVLLRRDTISMEDVMSSADLDYDGARTLMSLLVRKGALLRVTRTEYSKNAEFIAILKKVRASGHQDVEGDDF